MSRRVQKNILLIIDPQNDFHEGGSLAVPGATQDSRRIAQLIRSKRFDNIAVTLDSHQYVDIGHPMWWTNDEKEQPKDFSIITVEDIKKGRWYARLPENREWTSYYVKQLEVNKRFQHTIWPYHCIVGSHGHGVKESINEALQKWAMTNSQLVTFIWKGTNPKAEMYSAFKADVHVPGADETQLNTKVLDPLYLYDNIVVCGEASSHCIMNTVIDMVDYFDKLDSKRGKSEGHKIRLLYDCTSPVTGYEEHADKWFKQIEKDCKYVSVLTSSTLTMIDDLRS